MPLAPRGRSSSTPVSQSWNLNESFTTDRSYSASPAGHQTRCRHHTWSGVMGAWSSTARLTATRVRSRRRFSRPGLALPSRVMTSPNRTAHDPEVAGSKILPRHWDGSELTGSAKNVSGCRGQLLAVVPPYGSRQCRGAKLDPWPCFLASAHRGPSAGRETRCDIAQPVVRRRIFGIGGVGRSASMWKARRMMPSRSLLSWRNQCS
jgi:hypothetical protein